MKNTHLAILCLALAGINANAQPRPLQVRPDQKVEHGEYAHSAAEMTPDLEALRAGQRELLVYLPDGSQVVLELISFEDRGGGDLLWRGRIALVEGSLALLTVRNGKLAGIIQSPANEYCITQRGGKEIIEHVNRQRLFLRDAPDYQPRKPRDAAAFRSAAELIGGNPAVAGESEIDMLVLYTELARGVAGGDASIQVLAQQAVDYANTVFLNSGVAAHYRLVYSTVVGSRYADPDRFLQNNTTMESDTVVRNLRNDTGADLVAMLVTKVQDEVAGYVLLYGDYQALENRAFQVTDLRSLNKTFSHENGHLLGMDHDPANAVGQGAYAAWSHGHQVDGVFATIMSYGCSGCPWIPNFSNPDVSYLGNPTGIPEQRDNARTARLYAPVVAAFRPPATVVVPGVPTGLNPVATIDSNLALRVSLGWFPTPYATSYEIERSLDGVSFSKIGTSPTSSLFDANVSLGNMYYYRVRALNLWGTSAFSVIRSVQIPLPPAPPSGLSATAQGANEILLKWTDGSTNEVAFVIEVLTNGAYQPFDEVGANTTQYIYRFGQPSSAYSFRVYARTDLADSTRSNVASATTLATNPGTISGFAFNDPNNNAKPDIGETPAAGMVIYYDANGNGIFDDAPAPSITVSSAVRNYPGTNLPYLSAPNYSLGNLPFGTRRICASFDPSIAGRSFCRMVAISNGGTTANVNFPVLAGRIGVVSLSPAVQTVNAGDKFTMDVTWTSTDGKWVLLNDAIIRFTDTETNDALQIRFEESTREFSVYNANAAKFGPAFPAGSNAQLQTNEANLYLEDTKVLGTGPTGPSVTLRLALAFKPSAANKTYKIQVRLSDDTGHLQGFDTIGTIAVGSGK